MGGANTNLEKCGATIATWMPHVTVEAEKHIRSSPARTRRSVVHGTALHTGIRNIQCLTPQGETDGGDCCAICTDPLVEELWTCGECEQAVHRACLMEQVLALRSQRCVCVLPGLCSCRPAPTCPLCRAGLPPSISGRVRKCGTRGCTLRDGHGGLCSSAPPVSIGTAHRQFARLPDGPLFALYNIIPFLVRSGKHAN